KGWPGGTTWLNTSTVLERNNFAAALALGTLWSKGTAEQTLKAGQPVAPGDLPDDVVPAKVFDVARLVHEEQATRPEEATNALLNVLLPGVARPEARPKLAAFMADGHPTGAALDRRAREAAHAIMAMPEYQLA